MSWGKGFKALALLVFIGVCLLGAGTVPHWLVLDGQILAAVGAVFFFLGGALLGGIVLGRL